MMRIGLGFDIHRLAAGRPLILGGVTIPHTTGLMGHSDADALAHAVADALLGALALGDIGEHFPDTDSRYAGADSLELLRHVVQLVSEQGWRPVNVDANIIAQRPKLLPYKLAMRENLAVCLELPLDCVSVKARTHEGVGPEGREEAISVHAIVLLRRV